VIRPHVDVETKKHVYLFFPFFLTPPVNRYELLALEQASQGLNEERMVLAFQALDEVTPKLGVYSKLVSKLRNDFFSMYSSLLFFCQFHQISVPSLSPISL
jgi:hypothetical protein